MPAPSTEYMNARRASKPASGGSFKDWGGQCLNQPEPLDIAANIFSDFRLWAECSRQRYLKAWGFEETLDTDMVF